MLIFELSEICICHLYICMISTTALGRLDWLGQEVNSTQIVNKMVTLPFVRIIIIATFVSRRFWSWWKQCLNKGKYKAKFRDSKEVIISFLIQLILENQLNENSFHSNNTLYLNELFLDSIRYVIYFFFSACNLKIIAFLIYWDI